MNNNLCLTQTQDFVASVRQSLLDSSLIAQTNTFLYDTKIIKCGNYIQVYNYESQRLKKNDSLPLVDKPKIFFIKEVYSKLTLSEHKKEIRKDNIARSKFSLQRLCKANIDSFVTFVTLTFATNETDINKANKEFNIWRTRIKKAFPEFKYICVPEFQKRGATHYHLLTNIPLNSNLIKPQSNKQNCYDVEFWNYGFTSAFSLNGLDAVAYISKYLTKNIDNRLFYHKRYFYSKNLYTPKTEYLNLCSSTEDNLYIENLTAKSKLRFSNTYKNPYSKEQVCFFELLNR